MDSITELKSELANVKAENERLKEDLDIETHNRIEYQKSFERGYGVYLDTLKELAKYKEALEFADKFIAVVMRRTHHGNDWIRDYETGNMVVELVEGLTKFKDLYSQALNQEKGVE